MTHYGYREAAAEDVDSIVSVYNSNVAFLQSHLGVDHVDSDFIAREMIAMQQDGFVSAVIVDPQSKVVGVLDYKQDKTAYLSLIMISAAHHGHGIAVQVYRELENNLRQQGTDTVRIDVVNDYEGNVVGYWEKLGFVQQEEIMLTWGDKQSRAVVMRKTL